MSLSNRKYFEIWGDEVSQNYILKYLLLIITSLLAIESVTIAFLGFRKPTLIAIGGIDTKILTFPPPSPDILRNELGRFVKKYAGIRYAFRADSIDERLANAKRLIAPDFQKQFDAANIEQVKLIKEKKISQTVYFSQEPEVDSTNLTATIFMDRIFTVENIRATAPLILKVQFTYGARTSENPEGILITGETLVSEPNSK